MTKYSYYLLLSCLMFLAGCQTVEPLAIDYMLPADVSFPPSLKRVAIVNNMPEVPDNKPILAKIRFNKHAIHIFVICKSIIF